MNRVTSDISDHKPDIHWLEGVLDYFNTQCPHEEDDPRTIGFTVGRQVIGLYLVEMLLKYALDDLGVEHPTSHNLLDLFRKLPRPRRRAVERKYQQILRNRAQEAWDFQKSVDEFLQFLGNNPITDSRYFWERSDPGLLFMPNRLADVVHALFIELHNYPESAPPANRFDTKFIPFAENRPEAT